MDLPSVDNALPTVFGAILGRMLSTQSPPSVPNESEPQLGNPKTHEGSVLCIAQSLQRTNRPRASPFVADVLPTISGAKLRDTLSLVLSGPMAKNDHKSGVVMRVRPMGHLQITKSFRFACMLHLTCFSCCVPKFRDTLFRVGPHDRPPFSIRNPFNSGCAPSRVCVCRPFYEVDFVPLFDFACIMIIAYVLSLLTL